MTLSCWKPNFAQIGGFLYFGGHSWFKMATRVNQNGRHMVQHVLLPVNIHFHWNLSIFEFLKFLYWRPFWKFLKQRAQLWVMIYFCVKFQKGSAVWFELSIFLHLSYHGNGRHFKKNSTPKRCHTLRWIFLQSFMKFDERNHFFNPPFFISMATAEKFVQLIPICLAYLVPLDVDVVPIKIHQFLLWSFLCFSFF